MTNPDQTQAQPVTIGGETVSLGSFSAFKSFAIMDVIAAAEQIYRDVLYGAAEFKQEFEKRNVVELDRVEARREFRPRPLYKTIREEVEDGLVVVREEPIVDEKTGELLLGPDPLGHITDDDWKASGNVLRVGSSPSENTIYAAMIPRAFKMAREEVLKLLALVVVRNSDLEKWDEDGNVDDEIAKEAKRILHAAHGEELPRLAAAALRLCREQIRGPFDDLVAEVRTTFQKPTPETEEETAGTDGSSTSEASEASPTAPGPMRVETPTSPTSSTDSPADSAGSPGPSSTEPASV